MVSQAVLRTKCCALISSMKFHCLLVGKICVDGDSLAQNYVSLLSGENPVALQRNLAKGARYTEHVDESETTNDE